MSNDTEIRKSVKSLAKSESRLLDLIASAEIQKEVESRVIKVIKAQSTEIEDQTGSKPSLTDDETKEYLDKVLKEKGDDRANNKIQPLICYQFAY